jgi:hypothetical protein
MNRSLIMVVAVLIVAGAFGLEAARGGDEPPWLKALSARSAALNEKYGLGDARAAARADSQPWQRALRLRSEALNRKYELGEHAPGS